MLHILFPLNPLTREPYHTEREAGHMPSRRLLSVSLAVQLSGFAAPDERCRLLLARYVAGKLPLTAVLPCLTQRAV
jgi:hypothetical protein